MCFIFAGTGSSLLQAGFLYGQSGACSLVVNAPRHGIETVAPASASRLLTSGPPGKFRKLLLSVQFSNIKYLHNVV